MTGKSKRWRMRGADGVLTPLDDDSCKPAVDEVLIEIDSCSLWSAGVGFAYGGDHGGADHLTVAHRVRGHVVEAGDDALFFADRPVALKATVPCEQNEGCLGGGVTACPNRSACGDGASASIVARARDICLDERHHAHPIGPGLIPFKDG